MADIFELIRNIQSLQREMEAQSDRFMINLEELLDKPHIKTPQEDASRFQVRHQKTLLDGIRPLLGECTLSFNRMVEIHRALERECFKLYKEIKGENVGRKFLEEQRETNGENIERIQIYREENNRLVNTFLEVDEAVNAVWDQHFPTPPRAGSPPSQRTFSPPTFPRRRSSSSASSSAARPRSRSSPLNPDRENPSEENPRSPRPGGPGGSGGGSS